ncbi:MAG: NAD(P)H-binding protein [Actinomycetes bacterium]
MKILVIGATGNLGACVVSEGVSRGHDVTAVSRHPTEADSLPSARWVAIDASDSDVQREQPGNDERVRLMLKEAAEPVFEAYGQIRTSVTPWTFLSPAGQLEDGLRTGTYRSGGEVRITGTTTTGRISFADFAVAAVDELEVRAHVGSQFNVAY